MILNRRTLLATIGLALPAVGAEAATVSHKKKKPLHASKASGVKTASAKSHHKAHPHPTTAPAQS